MARPVKWALDLHLLRERAAASRTETWSRQDMEHLFSVSRGTAQTLMKAIGNIQTIGATHFINRLFLVAFLDAMIAAPSVEEGLRVRLTEAEPAPVRKRMKVSLPADLRHSMLPDLPPNIALSAGRLAITSGTAVGMLESLLALAMVMQNDLDRFRSVIEPDLPPHVEDDDLRGMIERMRNIDRHA